MALEVGIVGLPSSGKTTLFRALTRAETHGSGKEHVGMAQIADERLDALAKKVGARKVTPAAVRVVDVPGTGPQLLGNLRQVDALLVVLDGFSGTRVPDDDLETLKLELLVADRDHVERRLERGTKQGKAGGARHEAGEVGGGATAEGGRGARAAAPPPRRRQRAHRRARRAAARARAAD